MLITLYRKLFPLTLRIFLYDLFLGNALFFLRNIKVIAKSKFTFLFHFLLPKTEENKVFSFMGKYGLTSYPYDYMLAYKNKDIQVEQDEDKNLPYVQHHGKRLYFPEFYTVEKVKKDYRALLIEQDIHSAHRYVRSYSELENRILLDVGAAEGIFSLDTIDITQRVIIFEREAYWLKPLQATFAPWSNKVTFVKKYVGNQSTGDFVTIDEFMVGRSQKDLFIKMDIEGAERIALEGADKTLRTGENIQMAICTYHRKKDPEYMANLLSAYGFSFEFSDGLMYWNKRLSKGIIRCKKL